jgi:cyclophilin family peptidyl-prolyl cis-trans isomerase
VSGTKLKYHAGTKSLTITAPVSANTVYKVRLSGKLVKSAAGARLDGEFRGATTRSGNNRAGGDFFMMTAAPSQQIARFTTTYGIMDVRMFQTQAPKTVANFMGYANSGDWDGTIFHRSVNNFVIQGGGFKVGSDNRYAPVHDNPPMIENEPNPGNPGNIRGTIAMARQDDQDPTTTADIDSATDQWYFNVGDNRADLDGMNGGFTVFGEITNNAGRNVMDRINKLDEVNAGGAFAALPVRSTTPIFATTPPQLNPNRDSVFVTRLAMLANVVKGVRQ